MSSKLTHFKIRLLVKQSPTSWIEQLRKGCGGTKLSCYPGPALSPSLEVVHSKTGLPFWRRKIKEINQDFAPFEVSVTGILNSNFNNFHRKAPPTRDEMHHRVRYERLVVLKIGSSQLSTIRGRIYSSAKLALRNFQSSPKSANDPGMNPFLPNRELQVRVKDYCSEEEATTITAQLQLMLQRGQLGSLTAEGIRTQGIIREAEGYGSPRQYTALGEDIMFGPSKTKGHEGSNKRGRGSGSVSSKESDQSTNPPYEAEPELAPSTSPAEDTEGSTMEDSEDDEPNAR